MGPFWPRKQDSQTSGGIGARRASQDPEGFDRTASQPIRHAEILLFFQRL